MLRLYLEIGLDGWLDILETSVADGFIAPEKMSARAITSGLNPFPAKGFPLDE